MKLLYLNGQEMEQSIAMDDAIQATKEALLAYAQNEADVPLRAAIPVIEHNGAALFMPGYVDTTDALGIKIVSVYENNPQQGLEAVPATMLLLDSSTGYLKALMDGTTLTRVRTGALAGAATDVLSRADASHFLLIGCGGQAEAQLDAVLAVRPITKVTVASRTVEKTEAFAKQMREKYPDVSITATDDVEAAAKEADIITCVTTSETPVIQGDWIKPGTHINGMGSYTKAMQEIATDVFQKANRVYVDTYDAVGEAGDFQTPFGEGAFSMDKVDGMLGQVLSDDKPGRASDDEITIFKSTGNAVFDVVVAEEIYTAALDDNRGQWIK